MQLEWVALVQYAIQTKLSAETFFFPLTTVRPSIRKELCRLLKRLRRNMIQVFGIHGFLQRPLKEGTVEWTIHLYP